MTTAASDWEAVVYDDDIDYGSEPPEMPDDELAAFDRANWHLREISRIRARRHDLEANFEAEVRRLQMRLDRRLEMLAGEERWHTTPLQNLHRAVLARDAKRKTINLACGTLKARGQQPEWRYVAPVTSGQYATADEQPENVEAFVAWAREHHPELVAPRTIGVKVPDASVARVLEALMALDDVPANALAVTDPVPDKNAVKQALVKKDEKGKPLAFGVDPATNERPPGLVVVEREPTYSIDLEDDA